MEKEKLIELSKQYFDNKKDLKEIVASSDGQFFYTVEDAGYYCAKNKVTLITIKREDLQPKIEKPKVEKKDVKKDK